MGYAPGFQSVAQELSDRKWRDSRHENRAIG